jgi:acyl-coenzyme A synthetase/AMP-(fatty) acid ligase
VEGVLALKAPWPSIARTIYGDHKRYLETYMQVRAVNIIIPHFAYEIVALSRVILYR